MLLGLLTGPRVVSDETERIKAASREIDGPYPELARYLRELMGHSEGSKRPYLTSRVAARKTGVNHATITTTLRGDRPSDGTILRLANGLGGDAFFMLRLAGYDPSRYMAAVAESIAEREVLDSTAKKVSADVIIGNPPFPSRTVGVGDLAMRDYLRTVGAFDDFETDFTKDEEALLHRGIEEIVAGIIAQRKRQRNIKK